MKLLFWPILLTLPLLCFSNEIQINKDEIKSEIKASIDENLKHLIETNKRDIKVNALSSIKSLGLLKANEIQTISYVLASNKGFGRSAFGHSYIRFSKENQLSDDDLTYEFVADVTEDDLKYSQALGFGENYGIKVMRSSYAKARDIHVLDENRDMTTYVLDLNPEQKSAIVSKLNELLIRGVEKDYAFLVNNCADIVTDVLNAGLGNKLKGISAVTPVLIPNLLRDLDIIKDEHLDPRKTKLIANIVKELLPQIEFPADSKFKYRLEELLSSSSLNDRFRGYLQLNQMTEVMAQTKKMEAIKVVGMVTRMNKYEHRQLRYYIPEIFSTRDKKFKEILSFETELPENFKIIKHDFKIKGDKVSLHVKLRNRNEKFEISYPINHFRYEEGKIITKYQNQVIFYNLGDELVKNKFFNPSTHIYVDVIEKNKKYYLTSYMFTEKESFKRPKKNHFDKSDEIAFENGVLNNNLETPGLGMCYSHSELSQKLELFGIFLPNQAPLSSQENLELIGKLYNDNLIVIPGYANAKDFTDSIPVAELAQLMSLNQKSKYSLEKSLFKGFSNTDIDNEGIYILKNLIELGLNPIIGFETQTNIGHTVLVTKVVKRNNKFDLHVLDPNISFENGEKLMKNIYADANYRGEIFTFDPLDEKISTVQYGKVNGFIPKFPLEKIYNLTYLKNHSSFREIMTKSYLKNGNKYSDLKSLLK